MENKSEEKFRLKKEKKKKSQRDAKGQLARHGVSSKGGHTE